MLLFGIYVYLGTPSSTTSYSVLAPVPQVFVKVLGHFGAFLRRRMVSVATHATQSKM